MLARKEVELAKAEMTVKGKRIGIGAGAFGGAGLVGLFAFAAIDGGRDPRPRHRRLALARSPDRRRRHTRVVAGVLALVGKKRVDAGSPPVPEQAIDSAKQDIEEAKESAKEGRSR